MRSVPLKWLPVLSIVLVLGEAPARGGEPVDDVQWLVVYEGKSLPQAPTWTRCGGDAIRPEVRQGTLHLLDASPQDSCCWRATWEAVPSQEIVKHNAFYVGMTYLFDRNAESFQMVENKIVAPKDTHEIMVFDRHIFDVGKGTILAVVYDARQHAYLLQTKDQGKSRSGRYAPAG